MSMSITHDLQDARVPSPPTLRELFRYVPADSPYDFLTVGIGWLPVVGHALGIYNLAVGRKRRGIFFLIYATVTPFVMLPFMIYSERCNRFFSQSEQP